MTPVKPLQGFLLTLPLLEQCTFKHGGSSSTQLPYSLCLARCAASSINQTSDVLKSCLNLRSWQLQVGALSWCSFDHVCTCTDFPSWFLTSEVDSQFHFLSPNNSRCHSSTVEHLGITRPGVHITWSHRQLADVGPRGRRNGVFERVVDSNPIGTTLFAICDCGISTCMCPPVVELETAQWKLNTYREM